MFDFFDPQKNPFMSMMNLPAADGAQESQSARTPPMPGLEQGAEMMQLMLQMLQMQMQFAQMMWMMPMQLMQSMTCMAQMGAAAQKDGAAQQSGEAQKAGFQLGGMTVPPELLQKLLQMDMTPENLEKLQKVLDFVFAAIPENKGE